MVKHRQGLWEVVLDPLSFARAVDVPAKGWCVDFPMTPTLALLAVYPAT